MLDLELSRPREESLRRAVLAWSYLTWVHYAGYRYAATPGAFAVRRLVIQPGRDLPVGAVIARGDSDTTLTSPTETLVVRADAVDGLDDIEEVLGIGVNWGTLTAVLPFANDGEATTWTRLNDEYDRDRLQHVRQVPLRPLVTTGVLEKALDASFSFSDDGRRHDIAVDFERSDLVDLASGRSPLVIGPDRSGWTSRPVVTHELIAVADAESAWAAVSKRGRERSR